MGFKVEKTINKPHIKPRSVFVRFPGGILLPNSYRPLTTDGPLSLGSAAIMMLSGDNYLQTRLKDIREIFESNLMVLKRNNHSFNVLFVRTAYEIAEIALENQYRVSGEPSLIHPVSVMSILLDWGIHSDVIHAAALLHDVPEDTEKLSPRNNITSGDILDLLSGVDMQKAEEVSNMVEGLTKLSKQKFGKRRDAESLLKLLEFIYNFPSLLPVKLADNLHNARTFKYLSEERKLKNAFETREVYANLAGAYGVWNAKIALEDEAFKWTDSDSYRKRVEDINRYYKSYYPHLRNIADDLSVKLKKLGIVCEIEIRNRGIVEIDRIIKSGDNKPDISYLNVSLISSRTSGLFNDLFTDAEEKGRLFKAECSFLFGLITAKCGYKAMSDFYKNWIDEPRANGFMALRYRLIDPVMGRIMVQISTKEMDERNNYGILSMFRGKGNVYSIDIRDIMKAVDHFREARIASDNEIAEWLKNKNYQLRIHSRESLCKKEAPTFVPINATILDYARARYGEQVVYLSSARIFGNKVNLYQRLSDGDVVELSFSPNMKANLQWLGWTIDDLTRKEITKALSLLSEDMARKAASKYLISENFRWKKYYLTASNIEKIFQRCDVPEFIARLNKIFHRGGNGFYKLYESNRDVLISIGKGEISAEECMREYLEYTNNVSPKSIIVTIEIRVGSRFKDQHGFLRTGIDVLERLQISIKKHEGEGDLPIKIKVTAANIVQLWQLENLIRKAYKSQHNFEDIEIYQDQED